MPSPAFFGACLKIFGAEAVVPGVALHSLNAMKATLVSFLLLGTAAIAAPLDFWSVQLAVTNTTWNDGIFANGRFVVSLNNPNAATLTSEDGLVWKRTREEAIRQLAAGNGLFVGVVGSGEQQAVVSSGDGEAWIARRLPYQGEVVSLTYGLGKFWIHGSNFGPLQPEHVMLASADGQNWEVATTNDWPRLVGDLTDGNKVAQRQVVFCHDRFLTQLATGNPTAAGEVLQSFDGTHFEPAPGWPAFISIAHLNGNWVLVNKTNAAISVSTNGEAWTTFSPSPFWRNGQIRSDGQRLFSHSWGNFFFESTNGLTWVDHQVDLNIPGAQFNLTTPLISGANRTLALGRRLLPPVGTKPQPDTNVARVYVSQPLAPPEPATLLARLRPALTIETGTTGSGYRIEAADILTGPWIPLATVFPTNFPFSFLAPESDQQFRFYRAVVR